MERIAFGIADAAKAAGICRTLLYEAISDGRLVARKIGRRTLITCDELERFIGALPRIPVKREALHEK